ncbi:hypothetical protein [Mycoplasmopsis pulmonis]|uniref:hypothetical protein n=1 Tax=Mycoplasmopsis pulmonis TaxID=2107 RepID=UPI002ACD687D|nr:hypothetical protein [Mycoplasmopsis pulmonis]MDZ7293126.1 hypothetical protein [Mycoplasmopsis pulmonis]
MTKKNKNLKKSKFCTFFSFPFLLALVPFVALSCAQNNQDKNSNPKDEQKINQGKTSKEQEKTDQTNKNEGSNKDMTTPSKPEKKDENTSNNNQKNNSSSSNNSQDKNNQSTKQDEKQSEGQKQSDTSQNQEQQKKVDIQKFFDNFKISVKNTDKFPSMLLKNESDFEIEKENFNLTNDDAFSKLDVKINALELDDLKGTLKVKVSVLDGEKKRTKEFSFSDLQSEAKFSTNHFFLGKDIKITNDKTIFQDANKFVEELKKITDANEKVKKLQEIIDFEISLKEDEKHLSDKIKVSSIFSEKLEVKSQGESNLRLKANTLNFKYKLTLNHSFKKLENNKISTVTKTSENGNLEINKLISEAKEINVPFKLQLKALFDSIEPREEITEMDYKNQLPSYYEVLWKKHKAGTSDARDLGGKLNYFDAPYQLFTKWFKTGEKFESADKSGYDFSKYKVKPVFEIQSSNDLEGTLKLTLSFKVDDHHKDADNLNDLTNDQTFAITKEFSLKGFRKFTENELSNNGSKGLETRLKIIASVAKTRIEKSLTEEQKQKNEFILVDNEETIKILKENLNSQNTGRSAIKLQYKSSNESEDVTKNENNIWLEDIVEKYVPSIEYTKFEYNPKTKDLKVFYTLTLTVNEKNFSSNTYYQINLNSTNREKKQN